MVFLNVITISNSFTRNMVMIKNQLADYAFMPLK